MGHGRRRRAGSRWRADRLTRIRHSQAIREGNEGLGVVDDMNPSGIEPDSRKLEGLGVAENTNPSGTALGGCE